MQDDMNRASWDAQWALGICEIIEQVSGNVVLGEVVFSDTSVDYRVAGKSRVGFKFTCNLVSYIYYSLLCLFGIIANGIY